MNDKQDQMLRFWSDRAATHGADPRANTNDVHLRSLEISYVDQAIKDADPSSILDFGCANGFSTHRLASTHPNRSFLGIDLNRDMIQVASMGHDTRPPENLAFQCQDIEAEPIATSFDFIYCIRVLQNMPSMDAQKGAIDALCEALHPGGTLVTIESYAEGYSILNQDREALGLSPLPIHPHLTLLTPELDEHTGTMLNQVRQDSLSSSYYLITRLVYSSLATQAGEAIDYDHPLHKLAAQVPQVGTYGPQLATIYRK
ncbi:MAG TPA: hypothetical protein DIU15_09960 [Deltaproteobacteria bacterium]|nr:hypothetical protein [Deltaproteobacteria bacterium]HCP46357.1 hypothetical protein [Deltaproteobacteria bacterium]